MKILLCEQDFEVGNIDANYKKIISLYNEALKVNADICILPELALPGYYAKDLFLDQNFINLILKYNKQIQLHIKDTILLLPTITQNEQGQLFNSCISIQNAKIINIYHKKHLPNYSIFDEKRYFTKGENNLSLIKINNINIGIMICEDLWHQDIYDNYHKLNADLIITINASPFDLEKRNIRDDILKQRYNECAIPIIYCNLLQSHDGIVFDGGSLIYDNNQLSYLTNFLESKNIILDINKDNKNNIVNIKNIANNITNNLTNNINHNIYKNIIDVIIFATKKYIQQNNFKKIILGLSGGIDSALVLYIASKVIGKDNVIALILPSKFNTKDSMNDAINLCNNLQISPEIIDINDMINLSVKILSFDKEEKEQNISYQNLQSRIRGLLLMAKSNQHNAILFTTGNKSEYALGYATIYGDMNGGFNPIKDLYKTQVIGLCKYINQLHGNNIIPDNIITKEPSAELKDNQKDSDSLPKYEIADDILYRLIEKNESRDLISTIYSQKLVDKIIYLLNKSEFKRKQASIGVKLSKRSFHDDWRYVINSIIYGKLD